MAPAYLLKKTFPVLSSYYLEDQTKAAAQTTEDEVSKMSNLFQMARDFVPSAHVGSLNAKYRHRSTGNTPVKEFLAFVALALAFGVYIALQRQIVARATYSGRNLSSRWA